MEPLNQLKEGNKRYISGQLTHPHQSPGWRSESAGGQKPFAADRKDKDLFRAQAEVETLKYLAVLWFVG